MRKLALLGLLAWAAQASAGIVSKPYEYKDGDTVLEGTLVYDESVSSLRPGIVIVHQWMGLTDYEKGRAKQLAELGYVALAADIFGKGQAPKDKSEAGAFSGKYKNDRALYRSRVKAAVLALQKTVFVDKARTAVIGYCFGGTGALEAARANLNVRGVASFHGGLDNPDSKRPKIKPKVLVLHGAADPNVPAAQVSGFEAEMDESKADWQLIKYSGAVHAFTQPGAGNDPSKGAAYHASADKRSWVALQDFLNEIFSSK